MLAARRLALAGAVSRRSRRTGARAYSPTRPVQTSCCGLRAFQRRHLPPRCRPAPRTSGSMHYHVVVDGHTFGLFAPLAAAALWRHRGGSGSGAMSARSGGGSRFGLADARLGSRCIHRRRPALTPKEFATRRRARLWPRPWWGGAAGQTTRETSTSATTMVLQPSSRYQSRKDVSCELYGGIWFHGQPDLSAARGGQQPSRVPGPVTAIRQAPVVGGGNAKFYKGGRTRMDAGPRWTAEQLRLGATLPMPAGGITR